MKKTKFPRIQTRLFLGLTLFIIASSIINISYIFDIRKLNNVTNDIVNHPFTVSNSVRDIEIYIHAMHRSMKDVVLSENRIELNNAIDKVNKHEQLIYDKFEIVKERFLGDLIYVDKAYITFVNWKPIRDEVIQLVRNGHIEDAARITKEKGNEHIIQLLKKTDKMIVFADEKAVSFSQNSINILRKAKRNFFLVLIGSLVLSAILFIWILYSISNPINKMIIRIKRGSGDTTKGFPKNTRNQLAVLDFAISEFENREKILEEKVNARTNELTEAKNLIGYAIGHAPIGIVEVGLDGKFKKVNLAFCEIIGYSVKELSKMTFSELTFKEDENIGKEFVEKALKGQRTKAKFEKRYIHKSGRIVFVSISSLLVKDVNNKALHFFSHISDISEQKKYEHAFDEHKSELESKIQERTIALDDKALKLEKSQQALTFLLEDVNEIKKQLELSNLKLNESNTELESFSYSVSHDLRAPLRHINGYIGLLKRRFPTSLPEKGLHYLSSISSAANQMGTLIDDLLQFSRTSKQELKQTNIDMNILVQEVLESLKTDIGERKIQWLVSSMPNAFGDHNLLKLVWYNLLSNAVKFTGKKETAKIAIGCREVDDEMVFFIKDNGAGFDMQYAKKLFGVFQRLHSAEEYEGTGIGLANVRRIIQRHDGRTWAEAELENLSTGKNGGASFYFTLKKA